MTKIILSLQDADFPVTFFRGAAQIAATNILKYNPYTFIVYKIYSLCVFSLSQESI
jgi:hypothetical protein